MKRLGPIAVCLAGGLVLNISVRASDVVVSGNPYTPIVVRNVFGLNPPVATTTAWPGDPLIKIMPNGIMSVLGHWQVLFKAGNTRPGQPAREDSYVLSEGQRQDDIEVVHIDAVAGRVTFNNHGILQDIPLPNAPTMSPPATARNSPTPVKTIRPEDRYLNNVGLDQPLDTMTPEERNVIEAHQLQSRANLPVDQRIIMIEAQRAYLKSRNDPAADLLPPTALTPPDAYGSGKN
jgi:hypothetical protein